MSALTEDELLDALTWTDESYTLAEFVNEFPLPQIVKIVRGHDGGTESSTLGYGEVLTLHALRETRVLAAEDNNGNAISVALDFPLEFQILPQAKDCSLNSCGVTELSSFYQTVKYVEVIQAHYGTKDDVDSTDLGEILEIVDISKPHKPEKAKVQVRNLEREHTTVLTSNCTAQFRPLLDWKKYKAADLKTHKFGFPVRVRLFDDENEAGENMEYQRLISKSQDMNVLDEIEHVVVITTTVGSSTDFKFCCEVPKDLQIKVAVADGFPTGAKHYTDIVTNLNERFDVTKFMISHQPAPIKRRDMVEKYDYDTIKGFIIGKSQFDGVEQDEDAPALPPRQQKLVASKSFDIYTTPPVMPRRTQVRKKSLPNVKIDPRRPGPEVPLRCRSKSQNSFLDTDDGEESVPEVGGGIYNTPTLSQRVPQPTSDNPIASSLAEKNDEAGSKPIVAKRPKPPVPPRQDSCSKDLQPSTSQTKNFATPTKEQDKKDDTPVASPNIPQNTSNHPNTPSQAGEDCVKSEPPKFSKFPPKYPKGNDSFTSPQGNKMNEASHVVGPTKTNDQTSRNESEEDTFVPKLPPKSPGRAKKFAANAWQVLPASPIVPAYPKDRPDVSPKQPLTPSYPPVVTSKPPFTPPCSRNPSIGKGLQRSGTLPPKFKFGDKKRNSDQDIYDEPYVTLTSGNEPDSEDLYEEPVVDITRVMPVAPQPIPKPLVLEENPYEFIAKIPLDLSGLSIPDVSVILTKLHLDQYVETFAHEMIDGDLLKNLSEADLESFEMQSFHRTKLLKFINGWRPTYLSKKHAT